MKRKIHHAAKFFVLLLVLFTGCHADLHTKRIAMDKLKKNNVVTIIDGFMEFSYTENNGMVFGVFGSRESMMKYYILTGLNLISILYMLFIIWRLRDLPFFYHFPFFLILSGAFGNIIDRIRTGNVVDFIHIYWKDIFDWPYLFNVADALICAGGILLFMLILLKKDIFERAIAFPGRNKDFDK